MPKLNNHQSGSKKVKSKKLPVQGTQVKKSSIAEQLETLRAENELLKKKNRALESKSENTPEDSVKKNAHIPKPEGEVGRMGGNAKKKGYHLRRSMGLSGKKVLYHKARDYVCCQMRTYEIVKGTYKKQDVQRVAATIQKFPWLGEFEQTWPVLDMIKQYLQGKGYHERKKVGNWGKKMSTKCDEASDNEEGSKSHSKGDAARDTLDKINVHETASSATQDKAHEDEEIDKSDAAVGVNEDNLGQPDDIARFDTIDEDPASMFVDSCGYFYNVDKELLE
ncbi:hypothetical protein K439DRAFT_1613469 [Ramaria rubella]|nr:hypothetical protein K439DRAFT_1613469 [Ramaria rubella]